MLTSRGSCVVLAIAALVASGPSAVGAPSTTPTSLVTVVIADAPPIRAGTQAGALGVLMASGTGVAGRAVHLQMRPYGATTFTTVGTDVSDSSGNLDLVTPVLLHNSRFRWVFDGDATYAPSVSSVWFAPVSTRVGIRVSDRTPHTGQRVILRGRTYPAKPGIVVSAWRGTKPVQGFGPTTRHTLLVKGRVRADGTYRLVLRFPTTGKRRLYVRVASGAGNVAGFSAYRWVTVH